MKPSSSSLLKPEITGVCSYTLLQALEKGAEPVVMLETGTISPWDTGFSCSWQV